MEYGAPPQAEAEATPTICLVGKGLTFDSGGLSLKPADAMETMKSDMGGAAAVFGAMQAVAELKLPLHVVGLVSAAENMPSATAYRPGDVIKTLSGKTIEVLNTDAEGRIILADALFYAQRYNPAAIVELSTLTGAIIIALGAHATGMMGTDQALMRQADQGGRGQRRARVAAAAVGRVPRDDQERDRRPQEHRRACRPVRSRPAHSWPPLWATTRSSTSTLPARPGSTGPASRTSHTGAPASACACWRSFFSNYVQ